MSASVVNGKKLAMQTLATVRDNIIKLPRAPKLRIIVAGEHPAIESFVRIKMRLAKETGVRVSVERFPENVSTETLISACTHTYDNNNADEDALVVQLPLPASLDTDTVLMAIPLKKDVDVLSPDAYARFEAGVQGALLPPVVFAVDTIISAYNVDVVGKRVAVVGEGRLVGKPIATWFEHRGSHVEVVTLENGSLEETLPNADIIVSGAGVPKLITPNLVRSGAILIDAGTSESGGVIVGDIDPACSEKVELITPVPGGIGPLTVAGLIKNTASLARQRFA